MANLLNLLLLSIAWVEMKKAIVQRFVVCTLSNLLDILRINFPISRCLIFTLTYAFQVNHIRNSTSKQKETMLISLDPQILRLRKRERN